MNKKPIFAKMRRDGTLVRVKADGVEETVPAAPLTRRNEAEIESAALADPGAQPLTGADLKRMRRVPRAKTLRRALSLTQEEFALRYQIPLGTLRDWEQGRTEPDQPARAYLKVIAGDPHRIVRLLKAVDGRRRRIG
jgi:putative transcriptional regulator